MKGSEIRQNTSVDFTRAEAKQKESGKERKIARRRGTRVKDKERLNPTHCLGYLPRIEGKKEWKKRKY